MGDRETSTRNAYILFGIVLLASAFCKLISLGSRELWLDETYSAYVATLHFRNLIRFTSGDVHPPLYYIVLWAWVHLAGDSQTRLRLLSVLINILSMVGMFFLGKRVLGIRSGVYAASLYAFSPMLFVYSLEVRNYMLFILVFVSLLLVHWTVAVGQRQAKKLLVSYAFLSALLFYIHYLSIFILAALLAHWVAASSFGRRQLYRAAITGLLTLALISPGMPLLFSQHASKAQLDGRLRLSRSDPRALSFMPSQGASIDLTPKSSVLKSVAAMAGFYPSTSQFLLLLCAVPLLAVLAGMVFLGLARRDQVQWLFGLLAIAMAVGVFAFHLGSTRYILPLTPVLALGFARVIQYWARRPQVRRAGLALGVTVLGIYLAGFYRQLVRQHGRPWHNVVLAVQESYRPGDKIVFDALYAQVPFDYFARYNHFYPQETGFPISIYDWWDKRINTGWGGPVIMQSDLDQFIAELGPSNTNTLWLVLYDTAFYDPRNAFLQRFRQIGQVTEVALPRDPDDPAPAEAPSLRLIRVSLK